MDLPSFVVRNEIFKKKTLCSANFSILIHFEFPPSFINFGVFFKHQHNCFPRLSRHWYPRCRRDPLIHSLGNCRLVFIQKDLISNFTSSDLPSSVELSVEFLLRLFKCSWNVLIQMFSLPAELVVYFPVIYKFHQSHYAPSLSVPGNALHLSPWFSKKHALLLNCSTFSSAIDSGFHYMNCRHFDLLINMSTDILVYIRRHVD